jgi:uncharacterized lipoprotein YddW (UPF0748 family)
MRPDRLTPAAFAGTEATMNTRCRFVSTLTVIALVAGAAGVLVGCRSGAGTGPQATTGPMRRVARSGPRPLPKVIRAMWVARFHYRYADDVRAIIENCAASGCNTVLWQVRGAGTVTYPSNIEPWGREFDFRDPGFDPLALAIEEAHKRGLRIEAWFNVMPGWHGKTPPPNPEQLYHAHPDWFIQDASGRRQPLGENYVILNPCLPEVRRHIVSVAEEIASRYDVDGLHLDYVRYAWDGLTKAKQNFPRDNRTLALYRHDTGRTPDDDPESWNHWRANQLTRIVVDIRQMLQRRRPGASLTAAVWHDPLAGYKDFLQNSVVWLRAGSVDALMPMVYTEKGSEFETDVTAYRRLAPGRRIVPGIGLYMHKSTSQTAEQLRRCLAWGGDYGLFSYESLFPTHGDRGMNARAREEAQRLREARKAAFTEMSTR